MRDPASDLATYLAGLGLGLVLPPADGANLFCAPMPEAEHGVPDPAVALINSSGSPPQPYLGSARSSWIGVGGASRRANSTPVVRRMPRFIGASR